MINKINSLLFFIFCISFAIAGEKNGSDNLHQKNHNSDTHKQDYHHEFHGEEHHSSSVDGELIMHHIQDGGVFEFFNPLHPTHPKEIHLTTTWHDISPTLANWFSWVASGSGIEDDPEQLFITKQSIMMFLASLLLN